MSEAIDEAEPARAPAVTIPALALVVIAGEARVVETYGTRWFAPEELARLDTDPSGATRRLEQRLAAGKLVAALLTGRGDQSVALARLARSHDVAPIALTLGRDGGAPVARFPVGPHGFDLALSVTEDSTISRARMACDLLDECGPFDVIGDVHGCYDELLELLDRLGYVADADTGMRSTQGRRVVFVGDLVDRGPAVVETVRLALRMVTAGVAFCAPGNHDVKLLRALMGRHVFVAHGLRDSLDQIERLPEGEATAVSSAFQAFTLALPPYLMLDGGALVVAHAGLPERYHGRVSGHIRSLVLYGDVTGEDGDGLPIRADWAQDYHGAAAVVYGHTPQREAIWRNNTINCDTGCVFGGKLTAVRWPERELISVAARREYARRARPL